jgi:hypothetical protein
MDARNRRSPPVRRAVVLRRVAEWSSLLLVSLPNPGVSGVLAVYLFAGGSGALVAGVMTPFP